MHAACVCMSICAVLIVVLLICGCIYLYINLKTTTEYMHTGCVYIYVCERGQGGGCGGFGEVLLCGCVSERKW